MTGPFLAALEADTDRVRPTVTEALRLLVADVRSVFGGSPPAQLAVALSYADTALADSCTTWRHVKRGTTYEEIGRATLQRASQTSLEDGTGMVVYRGPNGMLWVREEREFGDGRFERADAVCDASSTGADQSSARYRAASLVLREIARDKSDQAQEIIGRALQITINLRDRITAQVAAEALADVIDKVAAGGIAP